MIRNRIYIVLLFTILIIQTIATKKPSNKQRSSLISRLSGLTAAAAVSTLIGPAMGDISQLTYSQKKELAFKRTHQNPEYISSVVPHDHVLRRSPKEYVKSDHYQTYLAILEDEMEKVGLALNGHERYWLEKLREESMPLINVDEWKRSEEQRKLDLEFDKEYEETNKRLEAGETVFV